MCGILGLVQQTACPERTAQLRRACALMAHRGPDDEGHWASADGCVALAHRRLSILDLSPKGHQPMLDGTGELAIVFNGEIYNYIEIREELRALGHAFRTGTDTEVILEAYKAWGEACLERFNGMFGFALYDAPRGRLLCARDRYGEKPFLYFQGPDFFAFASEYKALLALDEVPLEYDEFRLLRGLHNASTGLDADSETVFHGIRQLRPAEKLVVELPSLRFQISKYWDLQPNADYARLNEGEAFELFRHLLTDSVRLRLRSDVPVGSCLSGGLDSSALVCIARQLLGPDHPYHCFTGRFPGTWADEWEYAWEVVDRTNVISHVTVPTARRFAEELPEFMWFNELPVGSSSQYAQWCVFRLAREHDVTVLLDGQGADEVLGGYEQYFRQYVAALAEAGQRERLSREIPEIWKRYPLALVPPGRAWRDRVPLRMRHAAASATGRGSNFLFGVDPALATRLARVNAPRRDSRFNPLASTLYQDSFGMFLTTLLRYGDRNSMAHSREVRLPFCDHRLAEFALSLPPHYLMGEVQTKRLLRESMRGLLPENIRARWNKQGFRPPQEMWFSGPLLRTAEAIIEDPSFTRSAIWNVRWWRAVLRRVRQGDPHLGWVLWQPLMMESWRTHFIDRLQREVRTRPELMVDPARPEDAMAYM